MKTDHTKLKLNQEKAQPMPLGAAARENGVNFAVIVEEGAEVYLSLYPKGEEQSACEFRFPEENSLGNVRYLYIEGLNPRQWEYKFYLKKQTGCTEFPDAYARKLIGRENWGKPQENFRYGFLNENFDWQQDRLPSIPLEDTILYRIHTRGFTKHGSSKVKDKGTFSGIAEKIPYLKELGVTTIELLPAYEFDELFRTESESRREQRQENVENERIRINYWGYTQAHYFAPKASYGKRRAGGKRDASLDLKELVRELHKNQMEISMEFYFVPETSMELILDCLIFWRMEYHIDAFHVNQDVVDMTMLAENSYLADRKLFGNRWDIDAIYGKKTRKKKRLAAMNDGFMMDMRRFLKSDENQMGSFLYRLTANPPGEGIVNYIANHDSLTLHDLVTYEMKHNEVNGENNQDGNPFNYSWNCGVEGESRRKKILERRERQMRNALLIVFLSQGIPMLLAGDEFGRTKRGNNNAYCQDNEISWINWRLTASGRELLQFTKEVIRFRKEHHILHMPEQLRMMDYGAVGRPDLSYHGTRAWYPEMETYTRHVGLLYSGEYARYREGGKEEEDIFTAYNAHWEPHEFALPRPASKKVWKMIIHTNKDEREPILKEPWMLTDQKKLVVRPRSVVVLVSGESTVPEESKGIEENKGAEESKDI